MNPNGLSSPPVAVSFALTDHHGRRVTNADYRGRYLLVYFGFTNCKVVCPRNLYRLSEVVARLGERAATLQTLYITVDPERDSPTVMRTYLERSYPRVIGLTGSPQETAAAMRSFRVFAQRKTDPTDADGYAMPHSALTYVIDPNGTYAGHFPDTLSVDECVHRIERILV